MIRLLFTLLLGIATYSSYAEDKEPLNIDEIFTVKEGKKYVEYYLSTDTIISPLERYVNMRSGTSESVKRYLFVTTQSQKWLYFRVKNSLKRPSQLLVEMGNFGLSGVDYYILNKDAIIDSGKVLKRWGLRTSDFYDRNIVIPYTLESEKEYGFLIRVYTNAPLFDLPIIFWKKSAKISKSQAIELGRGLFYGVLAFFIIVTGLVVYLIRERSYLYYWLYLGMGGMLLLLKSGIPLEIFWPGRSYFDFIILNFFLYAYMIVTLLFLKEFLSQRVGAGWYLMAIRVFMAIGSLFLFLYIPVSYIKSSWQDTMLIVQMVYVNLTNILVVGIIAWSLPKVREKGLLLVSLAYYLIYSTYLFNPFIELGFMTGQTIGHFLIYSGGLVIGVLLVTITSLRIKTVFERNRIIRQQLSELNKNYSYSLIEGQEKERKRVAEELHDGIGAHISAVKMRFSMLQQISTPTSEDAAYNNIIDNIDESCKQVREMSHELMPPSLKRFGIGAALKDMMLQYQQTYPIRLSYKSNLQQTHLDEISQITLYRLMHSIMELLVHSHCETVDIRMIILPSIQKATIKVVYTGNNFNTSPSEELENLKSLINLLQGRIDNYMSTIWDNEINLEIPVILDAAYYKES